MDATATPARKLADLVLGRPLAEYVGERRPNVSWRKIAQALHQDTQGVVDVAPETLRLWFPEDQPQDAA